MNMKPGTIGDAVLSLLCGLVLLAASRTFYGMSAGYLPDGWLLPGDDPISRLAFLRLLLFTGIVALLALPLSWPLARFAAVRDIAVTLPGASCAAFLFALLEHLQWFDPFPAWLLVTSAVVLFIALPAGTGFWWTRRG
ncbi:MAG TPA: hypothetical protein VF267_06615 [Gammaproteobacteria bacterium]